MVLVGLIALSFASPSGAPLEPAAPAAPQPEEPYTLSPCPEGAGCKRATQSDSEAPTWSPSLAPGWSGTPPDAVAGPEGPTFVGVRRWYGYQLMLSDFASIFVAGLGATVAFTGGGCEPQSECNG